MDITQLIPVITERWLSVFAADLARYLVGVGLVVAVLFGLCRSFSERHRIQTRRATSGDMRREFLNSLKTVMVYATVALGVIELIQRGETRMYTDPAAYGWWYLIVAIPLLLVLHDTYFYWAHRLMHHPILFRQVHRVHHLSRTPSSWAAYSFSVWEALVMALFVPCAILAIPLHPIALSVFLAIMIIRNAMGHSGIEFHPQRWVDTRCDVLTTVTHHDMHHQSLNGNYGLYFTWWDRWMGTELPGYKQAFRLASKGLQQAERHQGASP